MADSKYAEILRVRGFMHMPPILVGGEPQVHSSGSPRFCIISQIGMTQAVDELGETWAKEGLTSLSDLGFEDVSLVAQAVIKLFSAVEVDGERFEIPKIQ